MRQKKALGAEKSIPKENIKSVLSDIMGKMIQGKEIKSVQDYLHLDQNSKNEIYVYMMNEIQYNNIYPVYNTRSGEIKKYIISGDGHSLMKYTYIDIKKGEIYFTDNLLDERYQNECCCPVLRAKENLDPRTYQKVCDFETLDRTLKNMSGHDQIRCTKILNELDARKQEISEELRNLFLSLEDNSQTHREIEDLVDSMGIFKEFYTACYINKTDKEKTDLASNTLIHYYKIKDKYNNNEYTQKTVDILNRINILLDEDKHPSIPIGILEPTEASSSQTYDQIPGNIWTSEINTHETNVQIPTGYDTIAGTLHQPYQATPLRDFQSLHLPPINRGQAGDTAASSFNEQSIENSIADHPNIPFSDDTAGNYRRAEEQLDHIHRIIQDMQGYPLPDLSLLLNRRPSEEDLTH